MNLLEILGLVGNVLDTPGSSVRDLIAGENPFDQWMSPHRSENRVSGREMLQALGLLGENTEGLDWGDVGGFAAEVVLDPTNLLGGAALAKSASRAMKLPGRSGGLDRLNDLIGEAPWSEIMPAIRDSQYADEVSRFIPPGSHPLAEGGESVVLETPQGDVFKIHTRPEMNKRLLTPPDIPEVLQPTAWRNIGDDYAVARYPFADENPLAKSEWENDIRAQEWAEETGDIDPDTYLMNVMQDNMLHDIMNKGYKLGDITPDNIGIHQGRPVIIDAGAVAGPASGRGGRQFGRPKVPELLAALGLHNLMTRGVPE